MVNNTKGKASNAEELKATKAKRNKKITSIQVVGLIVLLLVLVATSVITTLMLTGVIDFFLAKKYHPANSMTDAQLICDREVNAQYSDKLQSFFVDDLSSRVNNKFDGYQLYYEVNLYRNASKKTGVEVLYIDCFISSSGMVRKFELNEEKNSSLKTKPKSDKSFFMP